ASAMHGPGGDRRGGDRERGDRGDRRGRRSRRGRGGRGGDRGGRGLPDSKFYSPRPEGDRRYQAPPAEESARVATEALGPAAEGDDFFVLPGETLAKYTEPSESEPGHELEASGEEHENGEQGYAPIGLDAEAAEEAVEAPEAASETDPL